MPEQQSRNDEQATTYKLRTRAVDALLTCYDILWDFLTIVFLLITLSLIHKCTAYIHVSESFKLQFSVVHEYVVLGNYILLAYKSFVRLSNPA